MDRNHFLKLAQKFSEGKQVTVLFDGTEYFPAAYKMDFCNGTPKNRAILMDQNKNSIIEVAMEKVGECE